MLLEIAQEARRVIAAQSTIWKASFTKGADKEKYPAFDPIAQKLCQCVGFALIDAAADQFSSSKICELFLEANSLPNQSGDAAKHAVFDWNDRPDTTHAGAVAALDRLVDYLRTTEGQ